jgi:HipA-like protein
MRSVKVYRNNQLAGILSKEDNGTYIFRYTDHYYMTPSSPAISLTLPKTQHEYKSKVLFPFFFSLLAEGVNKQLQCHHLQLDEKDYFSLLIATTGDDTIGAVTVKSVEV